jgi:protease-4
MKRSCDSLSFRSKKCVANRRCLGDDAASGGVYLSRPADFIVAELTTITGSISMVIAHAV